MGNYLGRSCKSMNCCIMKFKKKHTEGGNNKKNICIILWKQYKHPAIKFNFVKLMMFDSIREELIQLCG